MKRRCFPVMPGEGPGIRVLWEIQQARGGDAECHPPSPHGCRHRSTQPCSTRGAPPIPSSSCHVVTSIPRSDRSRPDTFRSRPAMSCTGSRWATRAAAPVLFLHGGPGAGAGAVHRRFFDPDFWRVVIFDQRGAGRSRPLGSLPTTPPPTWSPTSSACAAISASTAGCCSAAPGARRWRSPTPRPTRSASPAACCAASSSAAPTEVEWFLHGLGAIFPDAHAQFTSFLPEAERGDLLGCYLSRLTDPDPAVHMPAARAWSIYEGSCSHPAAQPRHRHLLRAGPHRAGPGAHRGALFRPWPVPAEPGGLLGRHGPHRPHPGGNRAGPLRHDLPGLHRVRPRGGVAGGAADDRAGCRAIPRSNRGSDVPWSPPWSGFAKGAECGHGGAPPSKG